MVFYTDIAWSFEGEMCKMPGITALDFLQQCHSEGANSSILMSAHPPLALHKEANQRDVQFKDATQPNELCRVYISCRAAADT